MDEARRVGDWEMANQISICSPVGQAVRALQQLEMSRPRSTRHKEHLANTPGSDDHLRLKAAYISAGRDRKRREKIRSLLGAAGSVGC